MLAPWLANVTPFTIKSPSQFRPTPPPALTSPEYTRDYNEAKDFGALNSVLRTPEQTDLAQFWFANYPVLWNRVLRDIAGAHVDNIGDSARLFALANMAMADAIITCWDSKTTMFSGGRSPPFDWVMMTATHTRPATPPGHPGVNSALS